MANTRSGLELWGSLGNIYSARLSDSNISMGTAQSADIDIKVYLLLISIKGTLIIVRQWLRV